MQKYCNRTAIISGVGGMDGFYLSSYLLSLGYRVIGIVRRSANDNTARLKTLLGSPNFHITYGDITDQASISRIISAFKPDEFYHLAANSFVGCSWLSPSHILETNTIGTINCLEAIRQNHIECKFYFAGSSEMYGDFVRRKGGEVILDEDSPMVAASPYGVSKVAGYQMTKVYRESYDMFTACGILFNHSAPLRGVEFFTRKVTSQLSKIKWGLQDFVAFGNLSAKRDEGYSADYCRAMHAMLQQEKPDDFVIATGETHSCQEWLELSLKKFELDNSCIKTDPALLRPNEVNVLVGCADKAKDVLRWSPGVKFKELNARMCNYDYHLYSTDSNLVRKADEFLY